MEIEGRLHCIDIFTYQCSNPISSSMSNMFARRAKRFFLAGLSIIDDLLWMNHFKGVPLEVHVKFPLCASNIEKYIPEYIQDLFVIIANRGHYLQI